VEKAILGRQGIKSLLFTELGNVAPLHVSLSRPLVLWTREKEEFLSAFTSAVQDLKYQALIIMLTLDCRRFICQLWM
jgi:hypothetical protein